MFDRWKAKRYLRKAAKYIEKHGWTQGTLEDVEGKVCLMGAFDKVECSARTWKAARRMLATYNRNTFNERSLVKINDEHLRSQEEAVFILREAAR